jgi:hypothetical protein
MPKVRAYGGHVYGLLMMPGWVILLIYFGMNYSSYRELLIVDLAAAPG